LVDAEKVRRIVFAFQGDEPVIIITIGSPQTTLILIVHHEIHVAAIIRVGMDCLPVTLGPGGNLASVFAAKLVTGLEKGGGVSVAVEASHISR
jgi:hypothetical protein